MTHTRGTAVLRGVDGDRDVTDRLLLRTVPGAVDYLFEDLRALPGAVVVARRPDGLVVDWSGPLRELASIRYFATCAVVLDDVDARVSAPGGAVSALTGPVRFRVAPVGEERWELRDRLVEKYGWVNDSGDWAVNIDHDQGLIAELGPLFYPRRFGELTRAPASTNPVVAAVMVRLAKIEPGQVVLDPCCGAGTLLVTAGQMADPGVLLGGDLRDRWAMASQENLAARRVPGLALMADATMLPLPDASVDRVVANLPFGKRIGSHADNQRLYPLMLRELRRVLRPKGRAVLLTEDKRLFTQSVQRTHGLRVVKEIEFTRPGAHPSAYVVTSRRSGR
ncbi:methyltransferase domain-containing protein [Phytomonospora endophytica]|uniref:SAM-dependent methyltransferase n=1 Tax=Phytomonospora endophytica TaxID=714109 RepID=A0A841FB08_9ACTN|nr:methyltransferase domain-containing protein [Phytomonospora endophytica]MBB6032954.1 SAM-dependent methyltransferase [Phytomonospora endophytica]GIG65180.1 RNA methyltransferase [Phytomonospora endophytica]